MFKVSSKVTEFERIDLGLNEKHSHQMHLDSLFKYIKKLKALPKNLENEPKITKLCAKIEGINKVSRLYAKTAQHSFQVPFYRGVQQYMQTYREVRHGSETNPSTSSKILSQDSNAYDPSIRTLSLE